MNIGGATAEHAMELTPPGSLFRRDFRDPAASEGADSSDRETIKLLQWNIERGYKLPGIIEELRRIDADVISLQARSGART